MAVFLRGARGDLVGAALAMADVAVDTMLETGILGALAGVVRRVDPPRNLQQSGATARHSARWRPGVSPADFLAEADTAARSARGLLEAGDPDGAGDRAYYATFDAARAALMASVAPVDTGFARTHGGVISAFGLHLVKTGLVDAGLGRSLNRAQRVRMIADHTGDLADHDIAKRQAAEAAEFVWAMSVTCGAGAEG